MNSLALRDTSPPPPLPHRSPLAPRTPSFSLLLSLVFLQDAATPFPGCFVLYRGAPTLLQPTPVGAPALMFRKVFIA